MKNVMICGVLLSTSFCHATEKPYLFNEFTQEETNAVVHELRSLGIDWFYATLKKEYLSGKSLDEAIAIAKRAHFRQ